MKTHKVRVPARVLAFITDGQDWIDWTRAGHPDTEPTFAVLRATKARKDGSVTVALTEEMTKELLQWADWLEVAAGDNASDLPLGENASAVADLRAARSVKQAIWALDWS